MVRLGPYKYGIISNIYLTLKNEKLTEEELYVKYKEFYKDKPFIRIYQPNTVPEIKDVVGTNFCDIGICNNVRTKQCIIFSVIDNIVKGAAGQAIQNMNIMLGIDEKIGLPYSYALNKKNGAAIPRGLSLIKKTLHFKI